MKSIGIIANPASGKDIRRLVSHATVIDNNEKINIVKRIILGAQALGIEKVYIMPDFYNIGYVVEEQLKLIGELKCELEIIDIKQTDSIKDSQEATKYMSEVGVGCILVLGGDGTNRAVAKVIDDVPIISISTGTNNVYPEMLEGTVAGIAAAALLSEKFNSDKFIHKDKRIEIYKEGELVDIALVDAAISTENVIGSKAIWNHRNIEKVIVSRAHPDSIGFSAIVGCKKVIEVTDDFGAVVDLNSVGSKIYAPIAAGVVTEIIVSEPRILKLDEDYHYKTNYKGTIALDGEREIQFFENQEFVFRITRNGPRRVDVKKILENAQKNNFFNV